MLPISPIYRDIDIGIDIHVYTCIEILRERERKRVITLLFFKFLGMDYWSAKHLWQGHHQGSRPPALNLDCRWSFRRSLPQTSIFLGVCPAHPFKNRPSPRSTFGCSWGPPWMLQDASPADHQCGPRIQAASALWLDGPWKIPSING